MPTSQNPALPPHFSAPFDDEIGLVYTELGPDGARAHLQVQPKLFQPTGIMHGGVYCAMIESVASVSAYVWLNGLTAGQDAEAPVRNVVGVNNNTDFLRAVGTGTVHAVSTPIHRGRSQQLWLVALADGDDRPVARGQVRLQNLDPRG